MIETAFIKLIENLSSMDAVLAVEAILIFRLVTSTGKDDEKIHPKTTIVVIRWVGIL